MSLERGDVFTGREALYMPHEGHCSSTDTEVNKGEMGSQIWDGMRGWGWSRVGRKEAGEFVPDGKGFVMLGIWI